MTIKILPTDNTLAGKVADAELHFDSGPLAGLKLLGFAVWEKRVGLGFNVTFPARTYSVNGERRSFALLRPGDGAYPDANNRIRDLIIDAYKAQLPPTCAHGVILTDACSACTASTRTLPTPAETPAPELPPLTPCPVHADCAIDPLNRDHVDTNTGTRTPRADDTRKFDTRPTTTEPRTLDLF